MEPKLGYDSSTKQIDLGISKISLSHLGNQCYFYTVTCHELEEPDKGASKVIVGFETGTIDSIEKIIRSSDREMLFNKADFVRIYSSLGHITIIKTRFGNRILINIHFDSNIGNSNEANFSPNRYFNFYGINLEKTYLTIINIIEVAFKEACSINSSASEILDTIIGTLKPIMGIEELTNIEI